MEKFVLTFMVHIKANPLKSNQKLTGKIGLLSIKRMHFMTHP